MTAFRHLIPREWSYVAVLAAFVSLTLSNGKWTVPILSWIAPLLFLRLLRRHPLKRGLLVGYAVIVAAYSIMWSGMIPASGIAYYLVACCFASVRYVPYIIAAVLTSRNRSTFRETLLLPLAMVVIEYAAALCSPFGSWDSAAYTQDTNLPLMQVLSLTGTAGVTFIMYWFGAVVSWMYDHGFAWGCVKKGVMLFLSAATLVYTWGEIRLNQSRQSETYVRIAGITGPDFHLTIPMELRDKVLNNIPFTVEEETRINNLQRKIKNNDVLTIEELDLLQKKTHELHDYFFAKSLEEVKAGAKVIVWPEVAVRVLYTDQDPLIERCRSFARENSIYLCATLFVIYHGGKTTPQGAAKENKTVMITPAGDIAYTYDKAKPVPGMDNTSPGQALNPFVKTPYGRISSRICFDMDFPIMLRRAGGDSVDIMLDPANEWRAITDMHTRMAACRAIENGFSLMKQTNYGRSVATDYYGRPLSSISYDSSKDNIMVAQIPTRGVRTIYAIIGDAFAWLCGAFLLWLVFNRMKQSAQRRTR